MWLWQSLKWVFKAKLNFIALFVMFSQVWPDFHTKLIFLIRLRGLNEKRAEKPRDISGLLLKILPCDKIWLIQVPCVSAVSINPLPKYWLTRSPEFPLDIPVVTFWPEMMFSTRKLESRSRNFFSATHYWLLCQFFITWLSFLEELHAWIRFQACMTCGNDVPSRSYYAVSYSLKSQVHADMSTAPHPQMVHF